MVSSILVIMVILVFALREQTIDAADRDLTTISGITAEQTGQTLSAVDIMLRSIQEEAGKPSLPDRDALRGLATTLAFQQSLVQWRQLLPQVDATAVIDSDGEILANTRQFPAPRLNTGEARFFRELKDHPDRGLVIDDPLLMPLNGKWMVYLARALIDDHGRFIGIVLAGMQVDYFERYFSMINVGRDTAVTLSTQTPLIIARAPHSEAFMGKPLPSQSDTFVRPSPGQSVLNVDTGIDHVLRRIATTSFSVQGNALYLSVSQSESSILRPWRSTLLRIVGVSVLTILVVGILVLLLFRALQGEEDWRVAAIEREAQLSRQTVELAAARDQAQTANRARGEFLANMSHELRTPLNAVLGFSEILEKELFGPLGDPRYKEFIADIHGSGRHLLEIIGNILDLTKVDAGRLDLDEREVDVVDLMRLCVRLVGDAAKNGGVKLESRLPPRDVILRGDPTRLKQILLNLLSNAIKFTPEGKEVVLSAGDLEDGYFLMVSDAGIGMSPSDVEEAMQPFRQIDSSLARRYEGTGLGLPLTKSLVELHGGVLEIRSQVGEGTRAIVKLPKWRVIDSGAPCADGLGKPIA